MNKNNFIIKWRVYFILSVAFVCVFLIIIRLYSIQIISGQAYSERLNLQHSRPTANIFDRGNIFFEDVNSDKITAASIKAGYNISINPKSIPNPEDVFNNLNIFLNFEEGEDIFNKRFANKELVHSEIAKRVPYEIGKKIKDLNIRGVFVAEENWRFYPGNELAAHAIGFTAFRDDKIVGQYGLERYYENILKREYSANFKNFFVEVFSNIGNIFSDKEKLNGSLVTTIEPKTQIFVEEEIKNIQNKWNSKQIGIIVMNPQNGQIKAMALSPNFNLNEFNLVSDTAVYKNHLIESVYEMGSIIKPITIAAGLDMGVITPKTTYEDRGSLTINSRTIFNYDKKARGNVDMQVALNQSLNTGMAFIVRKMGNANFAQYMKKLFEEKTGIDLPNEAKSILYPNLNSRNDIEYATASYGQGIAMSPISVTRALATLGNGGKLVTPHLVSRIEYDDGLFKIIDKTPTVQVFKKETSEEITRMLVKTVDEALRGGSVALQNYSIAAKTGTAQIPSRTGGYEEDKYLHSFFGYFPAYDPQFIIFLYHIEPVGAQYASETLTDPFMNIVKFLINHYKIPADRQKINEDNN
ncbi:MAG TPA: penicillin-binding protein 2 [Candidatus Paceibacterota bacterium]|nr:penicillin-binding protein 2 [Candidatus Paceibacterota bacterium]HMP18855.1 penicillin-binding protein 2 [Candidatus Paceibacterota bacterium]HMP85181.1 penicillin-binding protein 2 [Candidatus Paceibacterota bacterium]